MLIAIVGVLGTVLGAVLGVLVQRWLDVSERAQMQGTRKQLADAQQKIADLEAERNRREELEKFIPRVTISDDGERQVLELAADEPFQVERMDYVTVNGGTIGTQIIESLPVTKLSIPINEDYLDQIRAVGPFIDPNRDSAAMFLVFHIRKDGRYKPVRHQCVTTVWPKGGAPGTRPTIWGSQVY